MVACILYMKNPLDGFKPVGNPVQRESWRKSLLAMSLHKSRTWSRKPKSTPVQPEPPTPSVSKKIWPFNEPKSQRRGSM